jgi:hypothetical protein
MPGALLLGRFGTHSVESHFGIVRSALRGQGQWRYWLGAEAYASLVIRMKDVLGLRPHPDQRRDRRADGRQEATQIASALPWTANSAERRGLLEVAFRSVEGDLDAMGELYQYTLAVLEHLKEKPIRVESSPSPRGNGVGGPLLPSGASVGRPRVTNAAKSVELPLDGVARQVPCRSRQANLKISAFENL